MATVASPATRHGVVRPIVQFVRHYLEMCLAMCVGFVVGDVIYFWIAGLAGYSRPFTELPELSVVIVGIEMTAPMAAWMLFRGMARRPTIEMSAAMAVWAGLLLVAGLVGTVDRGSMATLEHGLMMPAMLVPMVLRLDVYTGAHMAHAN